jgi:hypothetical protein
MLAMLLCNVEDPMRAWQYAERYLGVGTRGYSPFSADLEISDEYHPQKARDSFVIPTFWVRPDQGEYLKNGIESGLHAMYHDGERFLLPVHPETLEHHELHERDALLRCEPGPPFEVVPSANARTVFVGSIDGVPVEPHFLKLHYPRRLSRFTRRLRRPIIALQLWVAEELARVGAPLLAEVGGGVFGRHPQEAWGFVVRESRPIGEPIGHLTLPLFALYGSDCHAEHDPTLLEQLVEASGESAQGYVTDRIVRPMVRLWLKVLLDTGCAIELHGQNTLFVSPGGAFPDGIVYRDCAVYLDPAIREELGLGTVLPPVNVISRDIRFPADQVLSLTYDSFMGHHALDYIALMAQQQFGVSPEVLHEAAKTEFETFSGGRPLLPDTIYYYDDVLHPDGQWRLVATGEAPVWR